MSSGTDKQLLQLRTCWSLHAECRAKRVSSGPFSNTCIPKCNTQEVFPLSIPQLPHFDCNAFSLSFTSRVYSVTVSCSVTLPGMAMEPRKEAPGWNMVRVRSKRETAAGLADACTTQGDPLEMMGGWRAMHTQQHLLLPSFHQSNYFPTMLIVCC